jgi:hypothetical protein
MMQHNNLPRRYLSHIPYSVLDSGIGDAGRTPIAGGVSHLGEKVDRYVTSAGALTLAEYNGRAADFRPTQMQQPYRFLCDNSVRGDPSAEAAQDLYRLEQETSRVLAGKGAGLSRAQIEALRGSR